MDENNNRGLGGATQEGQEDKGWKARAKNISEELLLVYGTRKSSRWMEQGHIYDQVVDTEDAERVRKEDRMSGYEDEMEDTFPDDGQSDSPLINFFMSPNPMKHIGELATNPIENTMDDVKGRGKHLSLGVKLTLNDMLTKGSSFEDAVQNTLTKTNQVKHGSEAEAWTRQRDVHNVAMNYDQRESSDMGPSM